MFQLLESDLMGVYSVECVGSDADQGLVYCHWSDAR